MRSGWQPWLSTMGTNLAIAAFAAAGIWLVGPIAFLAVHLPIVLMAATLGVWLFYVQHQYEDTFWARDPDWQFQYAALHGSSHYDLPPVLRWLTGHIGVHHVHHLASRVPFYRLPTVLRDHPELREVPRAPQGLPWTHQRACRPAGVVSSVEQQLHDQHHPLCHCGRPEGRIRYPPPAQRLDRPLPLPLGPHRHDAAVR
jgi:fatty acid desaturase